MPSSARNTGRRSRRAADGGGWFTTAALERIVASVADDLPVGDRTASTITTQYLGAAEIEEYSQLPLEDFIDPRAGYAKLEHIRFYLFAGLIEIGTASGYIDLGEWTGLGSFKSALERFEASYNVHKPSYEGAARMDLTLIRELLSRLKMKQLRITEIDINVFYAFGSYLHLTSAVQTDRQFHDFIWETINSNKQWDRLDLSFLIAPQHFSEALGNQTVAGIPAPGLREGLNAVRYFQWLANILDRVSHNPKICDRIIRHARWSHHSLQVRDRLALWSARIAEWDDLTRDVEGLYVPANTWSGLQPSESDLGRLDLDTDRKLLRFENDETTFPLLRSTEHVLEEANQLISEGRNGAARQVLRSEISNVDRVLRGAYFVPFPEDQPEVFPEGQPAHRAEQEAEPSTAQVLLMRLVELCTKLAELGDIDGGAVFLVRHNFMETLGVNELTTQANGLLARSRQSGGIPAVARLSQEGAGPNPDVQAATPVTWHRSS
jgi:hypothetical protein